MPDRPRFLCPQCGRNLQGLTETCCPDCGFFVGTTRAQYRGSVRYWQFLRSRSRLETVLTLVWIVGAVAAYRVIAVAPSKIITALIVVAAIALVVLGKYLSLRLRRKR
ncbi:MAG TPA: hypothetical protein VM243_18640 [Phycisphaerae bacterium]|nr:hypothetical protein [Phycisphaerae bacterium]